MSSKIDLLVQKYQSIYNHRYADCCQWDGLGPVNRLSLAETYKRLAPLTQGKDREVVFRLEMMISVLVEECDEIENLLVRYEDYA